MKRWHTVLIGLIISAGFLYLSLRQADFGQIIGAFRTARYGYVVLGLAGVVVTVLVRGLRWSVLTQGRLTVTDGFWLFNVGFLFNNVLPARLGEFARAYLAGRRPAMHFTSALSSIVVERLFDMVAVVVLIGAALLVLPLPALAVSGGALMGVLALVGIAALAAAAHWPQRALNVGSRLLSLMPRISREAARDFLQPFVDGLGGVSEWRTFALGLGLSIFAWVVSGFAAWLLMLAFWREVPIIVSQLVVAAAGLGIAIPAAPSGVGPYEAAVIGVLTTLGYNADVSRSFAFALHGANILVTSLLGLLGLMREGVSFGQVVQGARTLQAGTPEDEQTAEQISI